MANQQPPCQTRWTLPAQGAWWLLLAWIGLISSLSAQSNPSVLWDQLLGIGNTLTILNGYDKVSHAVVWSVLTLFLWFATAPLRYSSRTQRILFILILASFLGSLDEFHQYFTPHRTCSLLDLAADSLGSGVMLLLITLYESKNNIMINKYTIQHATE